MARIKRGNTPRIQYAGGPIERLFYYDVQIWETGPIEGRSNAWAAPANRSRKSADIHALGPDYDPHAGYGGVTRKLNQRDYERGEGPIYPAEKFGELGRKLRAAGITPAAPSEQAHWKTVATARTEAKAIQTAKTYTARGYRTRVVARDES